jgi:hypothetical protein
VRNFHNRIQRLERSVIAPHVDDDIDENTLAEASRLLSNEDLDALISVSQAEEGSFLSGRQIAAQRSFDLAINQVRYS